MRRKKQLLSNEECVEILKSCSTGIMAVNGDDGYPYTVPLNYTYEDGKLSFHCAVEGHKMDAIKRDAGCPSAYRKMDKWFRRPFTDNRSVVVFGRARVITEDNERRVVLEKLIDKYYAGYEEEGQRENEKDWNRVALVEINIEHMTGKKSSSFV